MPITSFPPAPSRASPSTFADLADAYLAHLESPFVAEANALETNVNAKEASAVAASNAAVAVANAPLWVSGTTYTLGFAVYDPVDFLTYRRAVAGAGTTRPGLDAGNWVRVVGTGNARIDQSQTFTGVNTFSQGLVVQSVNLGRGGGGVSTNTAVGATALTSNTSGSSNTAIGNLALNANTIGNSNTAVGALALDSNTTGNSNTAVGDGSLTACTTGTGNTGVGIGSGNGVDTGWNTSLGAFSLYYRAGSGGYNTAVGAYSMEGVVFSSDGGSNTAVGAESLRYNTSGNYNVSVGLQALRDNSSGVHNTALGAYALTASTTGGYNTAVGSNALSANAVGGISNTAVGSAALAANTAGSGNTAIGNSCLSSNTTLSNCSGLGQNAAVTASNQVQLGNSSTTTYVYGTVQNRSDLRDKADVKGTELGLDFINALRPVDYRWDMREDYAPAKPADIPLDADDATKAKYKEDLDAWLEACKHENIVRDGSKKRSRYHHGLIAQEVQSAVKALGTDFGGLQDHKLDGGHDVLSIGYDELIAPLIKAVQELTTQNKELCARIQALETT